KTLTKKAFEKYFIKSGEKCWLIRSFDPIRTKRLDSYLTSIPKEERNNWTCTNQHPWFNFRPHPVSRLLVSSGFTTHGPKVLVNTVGAHAVGAIYGLHGKHTSVRRLQEYLLKIDFEEQVVPHANSLKKVEIKQ